MPNFYINIQCQLKYEKKRKEKNDFDFCLLDIIVWNENITHKLLNHVQNRKKFNGIKN